MLGWLIKLCKSIKKASEFSGEFWLHDNSAQFADGDIGDYNHEAYVIESVQREYAPDEFGDGEYVDWDGAKAQIVEDYIESMDNEQETAEALARQKADPDEFTWEALRGLGMTNEQIEIAEGAGDAREYAMKEWGWKRLQGNNVETWTLTKGDMDEIAEGLYDAYNDAVLSKDARFNIYVYKTGRWYTDLTYAQISSGSIGLVHRVTDV